MLLLLVGRPAALGAGPPVAATEDMDAKLKRLCGSDPRELRIKSRLELAKVNERAVQAARDCLNANVDAEAKIPIKKLGDLDAKAKGAFEGCLRKERIHEPQIIKLATDIVGDALRPTKAYEIDEKSWSGCLANVRKCGKHPCPANGRPGTAGPLVRAANHGKPRVTFQEPRKGSTVGPEITVEGRIDNQPAGHLWLAIRRDTRPGMFPKEQIEPTPDGSFRVVVSDSGKPGPLWLCILGTTERETVRFNEWKRTSEAGRDWRAITPGPESTDIECNRVLLDNPKSPPVRESAPPNPRAGTPPRITQPPSPTTKTAREAR
jgi:hypothetical protein